VKVAGAACETKRRVAASQPHISRFRVDMLSSVWTTIKSILIEETKKNKLVMYHGNDVVVPTFKRGICMTPDKQIKLVTAERQTKAHHKFEFMIAYTREHIIVFQSLFGFVLLHWGPRSVPKVKIEAGKSCKEESQYHNNEPDSWSIQ
jgi:hypothetical protein